MCRRVRIAIALVFFVQAIAGTAAAQPSEPPQTQAAEPTPEPPGRQAEPAPTEPSARPAPQQVAPAMSAPAQALPLSMQLPSPADDLSEGIALGLSIGGTAVSWAMIGVVVAADSPRSSAEQTIGRIGVLGAFLAPSFGHWYAHRFATRGLGLRAVGAGFTALALASVFVMCESECSLAIPGALLIAGAGFTIAGTIDDIATVPRDVQRYNQRLHDVSIVPVVHRDRGGVGLALAGRF